MKTIALIPVYKALRLLNKYEEISIVNNFRQLNDFLDIAFIGPNELMDEYTLKYPQLNFYCFKEIFFRNIQGYNELLKSLPFYKTFDKYNYLLIIQTDAWILGSPNDLVYFYKYDYCGAISFNEDGIHGFNGGLSLRNVQSSIRVLKSLNNYERPLDIWRRHFPSKELFKPHKIISFLLDVAIRKRIHYRLNFFEKCNEDIFWSVLAPKAVSDFKVISQKDAVKFSWEHNCEEFEKKYSLPFGCHGWWNYNYDFWIKYIKY